jgi:ribosomal protein L37E
MECPNCKKNSGGVMYKDVITCDKCGEHLVIDYCTCHVCGYTWRLNNGVFIDGNLIDEEAIGQMLDELDILIDSELKNTAEAVFENVGSVKRMSDILHKCIRCGEPAYRTSECNFKCSLCGFEWEMLNGGGS